VVTTKATLIICEKPDAALHIAEALSEYGKASKREKYGVPYYQLDTKDERITICSAIGHLYQVDTKGSRERHYYPVWDIAWKPKHQVEKGQRRQELRLRAIAELSRGVDTYLNSCDYDIEGSLIGYMILEYACNGAARIARRMKFSTLTERELREAYANPMPRLDFSLVYAGMCRHEVDWLYGVNLSRALTESAYKFSQRYSTLSTGRVQGPTLRFVVEREKEIMTFVPVPYWTIEAIVEIDGRDMAAEYEVERIETSRKAERVVEKSSGRTGKVEDLESKRYHLNPPTPFDLSTLQAEAYRHFGFPPTQSLGIAERLYLDALISYPRTSSQKLPTTIGYREILSGLGKLAQYEKYSNKLLSAEALRPNEGEKTDPAHPAIYPTGVSPKRRLELLEQKVFDLIVKRFMATFSSPAIKESQKVAVKVDGLSFLIRGSRILEKGWIEFYEPYSKLEETILPPISVGQEATFKRVSAEKRFTQPPPRYNPGSLLRLMEEENIGTKATRAEILDTLHRRGYVKGERIVATSLAFKITELLLKYCPKVIDVAFTRELEGMMERIESGLESREHVIFEAVEHLKPIIEDLKVNEAEIGKELTKTIKEMKMAEITLRPPCPQCGSELRVIRSRRSGKRFIGCSGMWKNKCRFGLPLPQFGALTLLEKDCRECGFQLIQVKTKGKRPMISCPKCFQAKRQSMTGPNSG
jgi:DNA topoisomerase-1